ncbi:polysaccharide biosynthesis protein [Enterococcus mundtii]|uniref:putative polysaccharide biosynthesis protein n=1 Tax=Enterococcus TaxID=1350 RepID=UPI0004507718|nr:polysaccharide biosynthesis protein [Enterococcus mundtii]MCW6015585.1 polysaccharide biosynthesis protein [Serratia marcescens]AZP93784.1 polysaccharide biosynthesis protein [Enterococcus mundtii]EYT94992.1 polysaccharide biosynthesis protein [Enterococcus mundtii CRL35]MDA9427669.1 Membrane protein involved in the export of O-antigen, teichoic acid lipoteichoic acid [Enterococcus mundtii 1A]MDK4212367.1 polysaccharide biosynthesis protein [Enterococcus mundtii]
MTNQRKPAVESLTVQEKMARGSAWMTASNMISRLLGAVYIIPWYAWMGENAKAANGLFNMGYNIYALFLMISTAGIPAAIAKQTARYNSLNEYGTSHRLFLRAMQMMAVLGVFFAGFMYFASPWLARASGGGEELIPIMRSLSAALLVFPCMSVIRGYFQGNQEMMPYALSQIVEQIARVFYLLLSTFIIMKVLSGDYVTAVTQSTFAAFIGMIVSLAVLLYFLKKHQAYTAARVQYSENQVTIATKELLLETIKEAIPFIIVGSGITIFKLVDQFTFIKIMSDTTEYSNAQLLDLFSIFSANPDKLTMVVIALATSIAATGLPLITEAVTIKDRRGLAKLTSSNLQLFSFIMFPATCGVMLLAYPLNTLFYTPDQLGSQVLIQASFVGLFLGLYMLVSNMLQGMFENKAAIQYLLVGFLVKLVLQYPAIRIFEVYGPLLATMIGFIVSCSLILKKIHQVARFNRKFVWRRTLLIFILTLLMLLAAGLTKMIFGMFLSQDSKFQSLILIVLVAGVGGLVYMYLALKLRLADKLLGRQGMIRLRRRLRIK